MDASSPAPNVDEKGVKSETPAPPLLPIAELNKVDDNTDTKSENVDLPPPSSVIYPAVASPSLAKDQSDKVALNIDENSTENLVIVKSFTEPTKEKDYDIITPSVDSSQLSMPIQKQFEYEGSSNLASNLAIKNEGIFDCPSPDRDEILPPVLTSEESYVPKDEMPTLHANTVPEPIGTTPYPTDVKYSSSYVSQMEMAVDAIKMEPGLQNVDENSMSESTQKPTPSESPLQRSQSPTSFAARSNTSPSSSSLSYSQVPSESPRPLEENSDKSLSAPSVMLPGYAMYSEGDRKEKGIGSAGVPPGSLNLSQHHPSYPPYYHYAPHPSHNDKMDSSPYIGKL